MNAVRYLIVNADDFGLSPGVNRGIITAHELGIVTSASLMVRWPAAVPAAAYGREHPQLSLGLHFELAEWAYREGSWVPLYEVVPADDQGAIAQEAARQLAAFRNLVGCNPSHLDSHQHVHRSEPARSILIEMARCLGIPLRDCTPQVRYCGGFYGQSPKGHPYPEGIAADSLIRLVAQLPPGVTELGCHPGEEEDLDSMYKNERREEVQTLCDPRVRAALALEGIELCSFRTYTSGL